jgi:hypothetical protein
MGGAATPLPSQIDGALTFPATFFIAALVAIGCEAVNLEDI